MDSGSELNSGCGCRLGVTLGKLKSSHARDGHKVPPLTKELMLGQSPFSLKAVKATHPRVYGQHELYSVGLGGNTKLGRLERGRGSGRK